MIVFGGDLAIAKDEIANGFFSSLDRLNLLKDKVFVLNLEGVIKEVDENVFPMYKLHNNKAIIGLKDICKKLIFSLANNHIYDYPERIQPTMKILEKESIDYFGTIEKDTIKPIVFENDGYTYALFGHCWNLYTRTNTNKQTNDRIVDCPYESFLELVKLYIHYHPTQRVICYMHWNFDLEVLPFPAYVKLAHSLIDEGVFSVIGNHSHNVQPIEVYNGHLIVYGLGNFNLVNGLFFDGKLEFPEDSRKSLLVELFNEGYYVKAYLCQTSCDGKDVICTKEHCIDLRVKNTMYLLFDNEMRVINFDDYNKFFKSNRRKKLAPVFYSYNNTICNRIKMLFLVVKVKSIRNVSKWLSKIA